MSVHSAGRGARARAACLGARDRQGHAQHQDLLSVSDGKVSAVTRTALGAECFPAGTQPAGQGLGVYTGAHDAPRRAAGPCRWPDSVRGCRLNSPRLAAPHVLGPQRTLCSPAGSRGDVLPTGAVTTLPASSRNRQTGWKPTRLREAGPSPPTLPRDGDPRPPAAQAEVCAVRVGPRVSPCPPQRSSPTCRGETP